MPQAPQTQSPILDPPARRAAAGLRGDPAPDAFPRLMESLANGEGELRYRVSARLGRERQKEVSCIIEGFVFLTCQATLDTFRHPVSIDDRLVLVESEAALPPIEEEADTEDYLVADGPIEIRELVEDAVILALPMVPRKPGSRNRSRERSRRRRRALRRSRSSRA
jgi:uncharacterized protein